MHNYANVKNIPWNLDRLVQHVTDERILAPHEDVIPNAHWGVIILPHLIDVPTKFMQKWAVLTASGEWKLLR
jgi:hypothetical protein